jgi:hypothetical protein
MTRRAKLALMSPLIVGAAIGVGVVGCAGKKDKNKPVVVSRYPTLQPRAVPDYLNDTILQKTDLLDTGPFMVSAYGLIANLQNTGGGPYPTRVRDYMVKEMVKHGFGSRNNDEFYKIKPEFALDSRRFAIVEVIGLIPPGSRKEQSFDVIVKALDSSDATSIAHGVLYQTDLHILGTRETAPEGSVNVYARGQGPVFVNPAYALNDRRSGLTGGAKLSLRNGVVMAGGRCMIDRPIRLQLRQPQRSAARQIEERINLQFQDVADKAGQTWDQRFKVAQAKDEGVVEVYVPNRYQGDWEHFIGVVQNLYRNGMPNPQQAKTLVDAALKPDARLLNISYAWEGLGKPALPFVIPLMDGTRYSPEVTFAAARAAAFIGEPSAPDVLLAMAKTPDHPFQLTAAQTLGRLPNTPGLNKMLQELLDSPQTPVRVAAYETLARNKVESVIFTKVINEQFVLDIVKSDGPPLIYASRTGLPRIALFGNRVSVDMPITFTALNTQFQISDDASGKFVNLFYRGREVGEPVTMASRPDVGEIIARLGGEGAPEQRRFNFSYGDVVGIVQALSDQKKLAAVTGAGATARRANAPFVLQDVGSIDDTIFNAPAIPGTGRPQEAAPSEGDPRAMGN